MDDSLDRRWPVKDPHRASRSWSEMAREWDAKAKAPATVQQGRTGIDLDQPAPPLDPQ